MIQCCLGYLEVSIVLIYNSMYLSISVLICETGKPQPSPKTAESITRESIC